jgi:hypothetical protein
MSDLDPAAQLRQDMLTLGTMAGAMGTTLAKITQAFASGEQHPRDGATIHFTTIEMMVLLQMLARTSYEETQQILQRVGLPGMYDGLMHEFVNNVPILPDLEEDAPGIAKLVKLTEDAF